MFDPSVKMLQNTGGAPQNTVLAVAKRRFWENWFSNTCAWNTSEAFYCTCWLGSNQRKHKLSNSFQNRKGCQNWFKTSFPKNLCLSGLSVCLVWSGRVGLVGSVWSGLVGLVWSVKKSVCQNVCLSKRLSVKTSVCLPKPWELPNLIGKIARDVFCALVCLLLWWLFSWWVICCKTSKMQEIQEGSGRKALTF